MSRRPASGKPIQCWMRCTLAMLACQLMMGSRGHAADDTASATPSGPTYVISGVVVSQRDGSPVPYANLRAQLSTGNLRLSSRPNGPPNTRGRQALNTRGGPLSPLTPGRSSRARASQPARDEASVTADGSGHFRLQLPHAGDWTLTASAHGFLSQPFDEHQGFFASIVLNEQVPTYSLTFPLTPSSLLSGTVLDEAGDPVEHAQITAELLPKAGADTAEEAEVRTAATAATDDRGHYELTPLQPGDYCIKVVAYPWYTAGSGPRSLGPVGGGAVAYSPYAASGGRFNRQDATAGVDPNLDLVYAPTWYPAAVERTAAEVLTVHAGEEREANIQLTAVPAVHVEAPVAVQTAGENSRGRQDGRNLVISRVASSGFDYATQLQPSGSGQETSGSLTPGIYQIRHGGLDASARGSGEEEVRELEITPGTTGTVTLESAQPLTRVAISFAGAADGLSGAGEVAFIDTASGRRIAAGAGSGPRRVAHETGNGEPAPDAPEARERAVYLPPGRYAVYLDFAPSAYLTGISGDGLKVDGRLITVGGGKPRLTLQLGTGRAELGGFVQAADIGTGSGDASAAPVEGAMVLLVPVTLGQPGTLAALYRDASNSDGSFLLAGVIPGKYILIALDHGWDVDIHDPTALTTYLMHGLPIDLAAGNHVERRIVSQAP